MKVLVPPKLVARVDAFINASPTYADRSQVTVDALESFLAEVAADAGEVRQLALAVQEAAPDGDHGTTTTHLAAASAAMAEPLEPSVARSLLTLRGPSRPVEPLPATAAGDPAAVTWGMHNRDFPTLWACRHLLSSAESNLGPVDLAEWTTNVASAASYIGDGLREDESWDLSGFPTSSAKSGTNRVHGRFLAFFAADPGGAGPLLDFGLAGLTDEPRPRIGPTAAALDVLAGLDGFAPYRGGAMDDEQRTVWINHLRIYRPGDLGLLGDVVTAITGGIDRREDLVGAVVAANPARSAWSATTAATNVNGAIGRLREMGLLAHRQTKGRYVLVGDDGWAAAELAA